MAAGAGRAQRLSIASNPHYPRLFGALPAAFLLTAWPLAALASRLALRGPLWRGVAVLGVVLLLATEGARTVHDYFVTYRQIDLYDAFNGDTMLLGERIQATPNAVAIVPIYGDATHVLDYAFPDAPILEVAVNEETIAPWLQSHLGADPTHSGALEAEAGGQQVLVPVWNIEPQMAADAKQVVPFYLDREGKAVTEEHLRNFDLLGYELGKQPDFDAAGNQVMLDQPFSGGVKLVEARWGAAYPNLDRNSTTASAGTPFWVILTWQVDQPLTSLRASVDLVDAEGHRLNHADQQLLHLEQDTPETPLVWKPNTLVRTYHLVDVPATQLPGPVALEARLYNSETLNPVLPAGGTASAGGSIVLDKASVSTPAEPLPGDALPPARPLDVSLPAGLTLLGLDDWPATVQPGSPLTLRLYWQASQPLPEDQVFAISLGGTPVTATLRLPPDMPVGYALHTYADLRLPPDVEPGVYPLVLSRLGDEGQPVTLGEVEVSGRPRRFDVPVLTSPSTRPLATRSPCSERTPRPVEVAPGQTITVTLAWQAQATPSQDLVRFVHY